MLSCLLPVTSRNLLLHLIPVWISWKSLIQRTNENMPTLLQEKSEFSLLGYFEADSSGNSKLADSGNDRNEDMKLNGNQSSNSFVSNRVRWRCGCLRYDTISGQSRLAAPENLSMKLVYVLSERLDGRVLAIPKLDHLHLNGKIESQLDLHVIFYEIPTFGGHHYSLGAHFSSNLVPPPSRNPSGLRIFTRKIHTLTWQ